MTMPLFYDASETLPGYHYKACRDSLTKSKYVIKSVLDDLKTRCQITPTEEVLTNNLTPSWLLNFQTKLKEIRALPDNYDGYGTAAPNDMAYINAWDVLIVLDEIDFVPTKIMPSAEEGIGIFFAKGNRYGFVECYNEGGIGAAMSDRKGYRHIWEIGETTEEIKDALETLRDFIDV